MEMNDRPARRVGTLTMGLTLVTAGVCMLLSMLFPALEMELVLQVSPVILISLGLETLVAARGGGKVKYDWVGMILCCLLVCTAVCLYAAAYTMVWQPEYIWYR